MGYSLNIVAPVFLIIGIGYIFGRYFKIDVTGLNKLYMYVMVPALLFNSLLNTSIVKQDILVITMMSLTLAAALYLISTLAGKILNFDRKVGKAVSLGTVFMNAGNIGIPLVYFAYGDEGVRIGLMFLILQAVLVYTLGIYIAQDRANIWYGIKAIFKLPIPYVVLLSLMILLFDLSLPRFMLEGLDFLGGGALPLSTLILGMQLTRVRITRHLKAISAAVIIRLIISPLIAYLIMQYFPSTTLIMGVLVIIWAAPSSVNSVIIATEYDVKPKVVSSINLITTILSIVTLPIVITLLT